MELIIGFGDFHLPLVVPVVVVAIAVCRMKQRR